MNNSIIEKLFLNDCQMCEKISVSDKLKKLVNELEKTENIIKKYLPKKDREKIMRDYSCLQGEINCEIETAGFKEGFKFGLLLGAD